MKVKIFIFSLIACLSSGFAFSQTSLKFAFGEAASGYTFVAADSIYN